MAPKAEDNDEILRQILHSVKDLKAELSACNSRITVLEGNLIETASQGSQRRINDHEEDTLSVLAGNDLNEALDSSQHRDTVIRPPILAIKPPDLTIKSPEMTNESTEIDIYPDKEVSEQDDQLVQVSGGHNGSGLYDPDDLAISWAPSEVFTAFLEKNFRRKLSYDQVCEILEQQSVPSVDALVAPTLDTTVVHHIAQQSRKFVQERDKDLQIVQRALLNATGPLCTLHDRLENNSPVDATSLKTIVEQTLCLLGSTNTQLSILRRKKVLASINKGKIDLATQPLPNAKRWLFGDDFPSIASKEAELSRGLAKNLAPAANKTKPQPPRFSNSGYSNNQNKYQNSRQKQKFFRPPPVPVSTAAQLPRHFKQWEELTSDPEILNIVSGLKIPFRCVPFQKHPQITRALPESVPILDTEVQSLLEKGAVCQVPQTKDAFYSRLFLVPKKGGGMRPVIDLSSLNQFIDNTHFQMEHLSAIKSLLKTGHFMTKLDLKDAYLSVPIHPASQKFLRFIWKDKTYQFQALPFGLNIAPRVFTRLLKPVAAFLRKRGVRLVIYLDDILIIGSSVEETRQFTEMTMSLLESLGFIINKEKSIFTPTQIITFLGFTINSITMQLTLPQDKVRSVRSHCHQMLSRPKVSLRSIAQILGLLESYRPAIWRAPLHMRRLQAQLTLGLQSSLQSYEAEVNLSPLSKQELQWWIQNIELCNGSPVTTPPPDLTIFTDASKQGWGAVCDNQQANGKWSATEKLLHINILELKGAFLAIQALLKNKRSMTVSLNMDNSSAVAYINHKGGTHSPQLLHLTLALWEWCIQRDIFLVAHHVPGKSNSLADRESRVFLDNSDWMLDPNIIRPLLGPCQTDLFATRLTHQLPIYVSWRPDPKALQSDAFSLNWKGLKGYAFPPFNLIAKVLNKILEDQTEILLVAPIWQAQPWWPLLLQLLTQQPVLLPVSPHLLIDPSDPEAIHPMYPRLHLGVFPISYNVTKQKAFQQTLPNYLSQPLDPPHIRRTNQAGSAGAAGVVHGKLILFRHR
jgi:hypothetical protein